MQVDAIQFTRLSIADAEECAAQLGDSTAHYLTAAVRGGERTERLLTIAMQNAASAYSFAESAEEMRADLAEMIAEQSA